MNKRTLNALLNRVRTARDGSNWQGKFTAEVREATVQHRMDVIAKPLDDAIHMLEAEIDRISRKKSTRRAEPVRLPYVDN